MAGESSRGEGLICFLFTLFVVLWPVAGADLVWEKSTAGWLVLVWCERKILLTGYSEQSEYYQVIGLLPDISYCLLSQCLLPNNRGAFIAYLLLFLPHCWCHKHMLRTRKKIERTMISETEEILLNKMLASSRKRNWGNNRRNNTMDTTAFLLATVLQ